ncbi:hypothetical protein B9Z55_017785 [Caenorhabditis nigoni]|nr:hypothetical protein B9Z55_017785 [Caenorhabditis nigoni]
MTHLAISLNRFTAAWAPYSYDSMFSRKKTKFLIVFLWIFTGSVAYLFYQHWCHLYYEEKTHFFTFTNTDFCGLIGWYGDFLKNAAIVAVIVCIDILTVLRVRKITRQVSTGISEEAQHKFSARDIRFLKQTVFQGAVFMSELLTYFFFPIYFQNPWVVFFGTSFAWVAVHAADGSDCLIFFLGDYFCRFFRMVVIVCNPEVRRYLLCRKTKHQLNTITRSHNTEHHNI